MFEVISLILIVFAIGFVFYLANKQDEHESVEICSVKSENTLGKKLEMLKDKMSYNHMCIFENFEVYYYETYLAVTDTISERAGVLQTFMETYRADYSLDKILADHYLGDSAEERANAFVNDLTSIGVITKTWNEQMRETLEVYVKYRGWVEIGDCEYFTNSSFGVYRFSDWKYLGAKAALKAIEGLPIKPCEDPKKTHWKHFLELEMKAKKQREVDCKEFVESILNKQKEYNDLQFKYEMLPSAPITDFESFTNFCKIVHTDVNFEDYEISNMLLLMKSNSSGGR